MYKEPHMLNFMSHFPLSITQKSLSIWNPMHHYPFMITSLTTTYFSLNNFIKNSTFKRLSVLTIRWNPLSKELTLFLSDTSLHPCISLLATSFAWLRSNLSLLPYNLPLYLSSLLPQGTTWLIERTHISQNT